MAPAVAKLEINSGIDSGLLKFAIGNQMSAGRVDITKSKPFSGQVVERMDGRARTGDEDRMKLQIRGTLDKGNDPILGPSSDIHQRPQAGEIVGSIGQTGNGLAVEVGSHEVDWSPHSLREIGLQRCSLCRSQPIEHEANSDRFVGTVKRRAEQNANDQ